MGKVMCTARRDVTNTQHACRDLRKEMGEEETFKWYAPMLVKIELLKLTFMTVYSYSCQIKPKGKAPRSAEEEVSHRRLYRSCWR